MRATRRNPRSRIHAALIAMVAAQVSAGCDDDESSPAASSTSTASSALVLAAPEEEPPKDAGPQKRAAAQRAGERVDIPAGTVVAGSIPGDLGRDPVLEPAAVAVALGAFAIDRLPFPNDPQQPPATGVDRGRAAGLCGERGGRLCSELEWERACKGPDDNPYAGGRVWEKSCGSSPQTCASGFGVLSMGAAMREWTASDVGAVKKLQPGGAAVRGAAAAAADVDHRCAHRAVLPADHRADDLGFRCCYGSANAATIAAPKWLGTFRPVDFPPSRLATMVATIPALSSLAGQEIKYFRSENAVTTVKRRGERPRTVAGVTGEGVTPLPPPVEPERPSTKMGTAPMVWNPVPGEEILLVTGRAGDHSFILAFHRFGGGSEEHRYRMAYSLVMENEPGPVVFVYDPYVRRRLYWTTCWQCHGETGAIKYRTNNRVGITQE